MSKLFFGRSKPDLETPGIMGILNLTPDSFYDGGRFPSMPERIVQVERMLDEGAAIIDIGAVSTRPGAEEIPEQEEISRLIPTVKEVMRCFPGCIVSVDTFRPFVARQAVDSGASMVNDVYGGRYEPGMFATIAGLGVPYVLMHMRGTPANMQQAPAYADVVAEVSYFFENQVNKCREAGMSQIILDPGFGFGKTIEQNYRLLHHLPDLKKMGYPILAGISRKSMVYRYLETGVQDALNGTTVLNTIALMKGADILRVHDVREAMEVLKLVGMLEKAQ
jgi:dihydropteroate synthase